MTVKLVKTAVPVNGTPRRAIRREERADRDAGQMARSLMLAKMDLLPPTRMMLPKRKRTVWDVLISPFARMTLRTLISLSIFLFTLGVISIAAFYVTLTTWPPAPLYVAVDPPATETPIPKLVIDSWYPTSTPTPTPTPTPDFMAYKNPYGDGCGVDMVRIAQSEF